MLLENHKYVESYFIEELPNGVIHLLFDCNQRELYYHSYSDNEFLICGTEDEYESGDSNLVITLDSFLPKDKYMFIETSIKNKEQISFYFIPYEKEWIKNRKFIVE